MLTMLQSGRMQEVYTNMWQTRKGILATLKNFKQVKDGSTGSKCGSINVVV